MKVTTIVRPDLHRGDRVSVHENNIRVWHARVLTVKFSARSGYWVEIQGDDGACWSMPAAQVQREATS